MESWQRKLFVHEKPKSERYRTQVEYAIKENLSKNKNGELRVKIKFSI